MIGISAEPEMLCNHFLSPPRQAFLLSTSCPPPSLRFPLLLCLPAASPASSSFVSLFFSPLRRLSLLFPSSPPLPSYFLRFFFLISLIYLPTSAHVPCRFPTCVSRFLLSHFLCRYLLRLLVSPPLLLIAFPSSSSSSSIFHPLILFPAFDGSPASSVIRRPLSSFHHSFLLHLSSSALMHHRRLCFLAACLSRDVAVLQPCSDSPGPPSVARLWSAAP